MDLKVSPLTVQLQTANKLRDAILSGHFKPGQRLVEMALCEEMNVSRTSVREALRRLEAERLIVIVPNKGPSVAEITWKEAEEIYHVRSLLEAEAAALFANLATAAEKKKMRKALDDFGRASTGMQRLEATSQFYDLMLGGCGNRIILELLSGLNARINLLRARSMSRPGRSRHSAAEMQRMLAAIDKNDPAAARRAAIDHVKAARAAAREVFDSKEAA